MATSFEQLVERQNQLYGLISRSVTNFKKLGVEKQTRTAAESRLKVLDSNWSKFQLNHEELIGLKTALTKGDRYFAGDLYGQCEESYIEEAGMLAAIIEELNPPPSANTSSVVQSNSSGRSRAMPKINLPTFSGQFSDWIPFRDLFQSMIISNTDLADVERLHYLRTHVKDEALQLIVELPIAAENFAIAWNTLESYYENKRLLAKGHFERLFSIKPLASESASELKALLATLKQTLIAVKKLGAATDSWDPLVVFIAERLLDAETHRAWEDNQRKSTELDKFSDFEEFLLERARVLGSVEYRLALSKTQSSSQRSAKVPKPGARSCAATASPRKCSLCGSTHYISACPTYRGKTAQQRREILTQKQLCFNCLGPHRVSACRTTKRCLTCGQLHHTSIHDAPPPTKVVEPATPSVASAGQSSQSLHAAVASASSHGQTETGARRIEKTELALLATASVITMGSRGESVEARVLLDQGSELSFITESLAHLLKLERRHAAIPLTGIGAQKAETTRGKVNCIVRSRVSPDFSCSVTAYILPRLTARVPSTSVRDAAWSHLEGLDLADPNFKISGRIDLLLGADVYGSLLRDGLLRGAEGTPTAQLTALGWIVSGPVSASRPLPRGVSAATCSVDGQLTELVKRFWEQEEVSPAASLLSEDEMRCEEHFAITHSRSPSGRYTVRLPFCSKPSSFGDSRSIALRTLARVQRRCARSPEFAKLYRDFLEKYEELNHMVRVPPNDREPDLAFYLPHHGVLRETSASTKLRVVFNGSQKTDAGHSLNDFLYPGQKLQLDLADVLLLWRRHRFVFSADIEKMFRQILVDPRDWNFQRILWSPDPQATAPASYCLRTVTYGLACAPFLALRVLKQLSADQGARYPLAREILNTQIYVDDVLSGADTLEVARDKIQQLDALLTAGGFRLQKWTANESTLLDSIDRSRRASSNDRSIDDGTISRALGLYWHVQRDHFIFRVEGSPMPRVWTKRTVLSAIARLFDPLGWLSPITIVAKILFQGLWLEKLGWDDSLSPATAARWTRFHEGLPVIETISVPRWFGGPLTVNSIELHGFSDASTDALAACVYLRIRDESGEVRVNLVAAKTRVAPLKTQTIPRLELAAAVLLTRLASRVRNVLGLQNARLFLWSDSTVALTWIAGSPSRWKDFVRNRVALIHELIPSGTWHHVTGEENPADVASRGLSPHALRTCSKWWRGPSWLQKSSTHWPVSDSLNHPREDLEERRQVVTTAVSLTVSEFLALPDRFSTLRGLLRVTAWVMRAVAQFRSRSPSRGADVPLEPVELSRALEFWTRQSQHLAFAMEIDSLENNNEVSRSSGLLRLTPFLDPEGTLRVGGRLRNSALELDAKHPAILSPKTRLATLLIADAHHRTFHGGVQSTLATLRRTFWVLGGRRSVRAHVLRCVTCARQRARTAQQLMGQLPKTRVSPSRPFLHSGVDYAGPFQVKTWHGRKAKTYKSYLVVFVCFSTSAVHLEMATDYSTAGFLAAYRRFAGRRGVSATLTSDCGTNLVGADAELRRLFSAATKDWQELANTLANDGTQWRFNPPGAPHFGGKWEAAVKSVKFHLRRVLGSALLIYEEFCTILAQVEAILNSRPICPLSEDPDDLEALTPGHFLIGGPITAPPGPALLDVAQSRLSRWQLLRQMVERFWQRWSTEYLQRIQGVSKWQRSNDQIKPGNIVLVLDERYPPAKWPLGRIVDVHPGADGLVRVVTIKTANTTLRRPVVKICPLPIDSQSAASDNRD